MAKTNPGFQVIEDDEPSAAPQPQATPAQILMLQMALKALSQRALIAATDLFSLLTIGSAFWLWSTIPAPDDRQIISLTIYALMILAINVIVRRK